MKICPKCRGSAPRESEICPHCGLVFWKWEASQKNAVAEPVAQTEEESDKITEEVKNANLGYLLGWAAGFIPVVGIVVAIVHYFRNYDRLAFQALVLGLCALLLMPIESLIPQEVRSGNVYALVRILLLPLTLVFLLRKIHWPQNAPLSAPPKKDEPLKLGQYIRHRAPWLGIAVFLLVTVTLWLTYVPSGLEAFFVVFSIPILVGAISIPVVPIMFIFAVIGKVKRDIAWMDQMVGFIICLFTLLLFIYGYGVAHNQVKENIQALIPALDSYRQENGAYPKTLELLDSRYLSNRPRCYTHENDPPYYAIREDGSYNLICMLFVFMRLDYNSATGGWTTYD